VHLIIQGKNISENVTREIVESQKVDTKKKISPPKAKLNAAAKPLPQNNSQQSVVASTTQGVRAVSSTNSSITTPSTSVNKSTKTATQITSNNAFLPVTIRVF
jgi:hypothetical protein